MGLKEKLPNHSVPVTFFEVVPPVSSKPEAMDTAITELRNVLHLTDAINVPEIRDEERGERRTFRFVPRVEPRVLGARILRELGSDVVVNRCVVYEPDQDRWFRETREAFGIEHVILVGGESSQIHYPGPSVQEAAELALKAQLPISLGGISIPSRLHEADRIRRKVSAGLGYFTTQVLFDSNDIVGLIQRLNGLEARIFLSFAPVNQPQDLAFLRWLGVDLPPDLDRFLLGGGAGPAEAPEMCLRRSLDLAQRILMDVFDNLSPDPPPLGLNVEHINRRNFMPAIKMLEQLGALYASLIAARAALA